MLDHLDAVAASPKHHRVLLETERIRILETILKPGDETAVHTHVWGGYLYILSWSDVIRYDEHRNMMMDSGHMGFNPPVGTAIPAGPLPPHSLYNAGSQSLHVILTELKT